MTYLYNILAIVLVLAALPVFIVRLIREKGFGERLRQSFGFIPDEAISAVQNKGCIWLHAASVGEIVATSPIVKEIRKELPGTPILVSVVTANGYAMAKKIIPEADSVIFFPLDLPWLSKNVIARIKPKVFLLVETELWPNFLRSTREFNIPVMMVNGRISDKSVRRYQYLRGILKDMLNAVDRFCMQSQIDSQYIISLGADPKKVFVTGNTKFDQTYTDVDCIEKENLLRELGLTEKRQLVVAGSTHKGEEELLFAAFQGLCKSFPQAGLIVAPREIMRAGELLNLAAKYDLAAELRTNTESKRERNVVILDTIGELGKVYSIGDVIFVGGSLVPLGGHNILEPAAHGKPIIIGPHMFNFKDSYMLFNSRGACVTVTDGEQLEETLLRLFSDDNIKNTMGQDAKKIIAENRGAAHQTVLHIKKTLFAK
jgi:3-deoxy-D-manno-octulosonic-acid transferase